jgi:hypothetical protein
MSTKKKLPDGAMVEISTDLIDEGKLKIQMDEALREAHAAMLRRKEAGQTGGECKISVEISMGYDPDMRDMVTLTHCVTLKTPKNQSVSLVKEKAGRLLCQPSGSSSDVPEQQRLFDSNGRVIGVIDVQTGVLTDEPTVAGTIRAATK